MRDYSDRLRKAEWEVRDVSLQEARLLVEAHHYARGGSNTRTFTHGLFRKGDPLLRGVVWWIPPTRQAAETVNRLEWRRVLSLSRMAVLPGEPKNACSFLLARSVRAIERDGRFVSLVTYADESREHTGLVYRASGWEYVGRTAPEGKWLDKNGRMVARKAGGKTRTQAEMHALGYEKEGSFCKHKFVKHLHQDGRDLV